jgi:hypothetical protein
LETIEMLRMIIIAVLGVHGIGHSIGVAGGWAANAWGGSGSSWLLDGVLGRSVGMVEGLIWLLPALGFVAAAVLLTGNSEAWRWVAVISAVASLLAIGLFPGQLPVGSTVAAVAVDLAVVVGLLLVRWPSIEALGA